MEGYEEKTNETNDCKKKCGAPCLVCVPGYNDLCLSC